MSKYDSSIIRNGEGYKKLIVWKNASELRALIYQLTKKFPKSEYRRISQMNDCARSTKQNIQEGYKSGSLLKFINFLTISQGSLGELSGDVSDCFEDELITREEFEKADKLCGTTDYLLKRLLQSLDKKKKDGTWKDYRK